MNETTARAERVASVVAGVIRQAVEDAGAAGLVLLEAATPEGTLAAAWATRALGAERVWRAGEAARHGFAGPSAGNRTTDPELDRAAARALAEQRQALLAHPANKTALLLARRAVPEPLLPLGDLYASQVAALAGAWSGPAAVRALAERVGGIEVLDGALMRLFDQRDKPAAALEPLADAGMDLAACLEAARFARARVGLVPKLSNRTLGVDLFG